MISVFVSNGNVVNQIISTTVTNRIKSASANLILIHLGLEQGWRIYPEPLLLLL